MLCVVCSINKLSHQSHNILNTHNLPVLTSFIKHNSSTMPDNNNLFINIFWWFQRGFSFRLRPLLSINDEPNLIAAIEELEWTVVAGCVVVVLIVFLFSKALSQWMGMINPLLIIRKPIKFSKNVNRNKINQLLQKRKVQVRSIVDNTRYKQKPYIYIYVCVSIYVYKNCRL